MNRIRHLGCVGVFLCLLSAAAAARQKQVEGRHCQGAIRHVHIALGKDPSSSMTVSFSSIPSQFRAPVGAVLYGTHPGALHSVAIEQELALSYNATLPRNQGTYHSPYQHHITIEGLEPNTLYYYQCLVRTRLSELKELQALSHESKFQLRHKKDTQNSPMPPWADELEEEEEEEEDFRQRRLAPAPYDPSKHGSCPNPNAVRSFRTAPPPGKGRTIKFDVVGDVGQFAHSIDTLKHLRRHRRGVNAMLLAGDIAYTELDARRWDTFFDLMDDLPYIDQTPLMVAAGNHDIDKTEHDRQLFSAYENRFRMPQVAPPILLPYDGPDGKLEMSDVPYPLPYEFGNSYYDFVYGPSHHIFLNSYSSIEPGSTQYKWFVETLESVDRDVTPWLFVTLHCPVYNTFRKHQKDAQVIAARQHIEPLLVEYKVNMVFSGHVHAYMRTKTVAFGEVTRTGPMYIVVGAGGRAAETPFMSEEPEDWVAVRDATIYGYGSVELFNRTHARWDWVHTGQEGDHNYVFKSDVELPPGGRDHVFLENQFFIEDEDVDEYAEEQISPSSEDGEDEWTRD